jgi:serine/threonine-protein kinase
MGVVLAATHVHLREKVAVKLLHASRLAHAGAIERFMGEARAASGIRGEHVVRVFDVGLLDDGTPYLVMEYLDGRDLSAYVAARGPLPVDEAVDYVLQACEALAEAHARAIVHRDLKPANLFLTRRPDGSACVKVLDFGVSKAPYWMTAYEEPALARVPAERERPVSAADTLDGPPRAAEAPRHRELLARPIELTRSGAAIGSPRYMAPEQMVSPRDVDARADVWSLGAVLFELVTGRAAFGADSVDGVVHDVMKARFAAVRAIVPDAPGALDAVLARCLAVERDERFDGVVSLARALAPLASPRGQQAAERVAIIGGARDAGAESNVTVGASPKGHPLRTRTWVAIASLGVCAAAASVVAVLGGRDHGANRALPAPSASSLAPGSTGLEPSIAGVPVPLPHGGECAELPAFASDGSVVSLVSQGSRRWIERVAPGTPVAQTLVSCTGNCWFPAPGGEGRVVYSHVADSTSMGLEVRSVSLDGTDSRVEAMRGRSSWRAGASLFFVREDNHAVLRRAVDGSVEETLFEAPSARTFRSLATSPDGSTLAVTSSGLEARPFTDVCFGQATGGAPLDCDSAGETSSQRPAFGPDGRSLYFARGRSLVRFELATTSHASVELPVHVTSLALAPGADRLVVSTCEPGLELVRWSGGAFARLPPIEHSANELAVGPHGEMAYPVILGEDAQLVVADESGEHTRVLTSGPRRVTEAAFSPDGRRVAFQDSARQNPGIFVVDAAGARSPLRLTTDQGDSEIVWLDDDRLLYLHPSPGYAYGRLEQVSATGGAPEPFSSVDGILLGVVPARHTILLVDWGADGTRFFERTAEGRQRELVFTGAPRGMKTNFSGASVSGRYVTWIGGGGAWLGDVDTLRAVRLPLDPAQVQPLAVYADDEGRAVVASRTRRGGLYELSGSFP